MPALPGDRCAEFVIIDAVPQVLEGDMDRFTPDTSGSCVGSGRDRSWTFTIVRELGFAARSSGFDSVLYLRDGCEGAELECNDDIERDTARGSRIATTLPAGTDVLFLDAHDQDAGTFTLTLTFDEPGADAGTPPRTDAGSPVGDAGVRADAGDTPSEGGGCGCRTTVPTGAPVPLPLAMLWLLRRRREA